MVSLTQKLEEIKTNFNSLRRYQTVFVIHTQWTSQTKQVETRNILLVLAQDDQGGQKGKRDRRLFGKGCPKTTGK